MLERYVDEKKLLLLLLVATALIRTPYLLQESVWSDEGAYIWLSSQLSKNLLFIFGKDLAAVSFTYTPIVVSAVIDLITGSFFALRLTVMLFAVAGVLFTYLLGKEIMGPYSGLASGGLVAINSLHIFLSQRALTDVPLATTLTAATYALVKFNSERLKEGAVAAGAAGAALFTKIAGILILPIAGVSFIITRGKGIKKKGNIAYLLTLVIIFALYAGINFHFFGRLTAGKSGEYVSTHIFGGNRLFYVQQAGFIYILPIFLLSIIGLLIGLSDKRTYPVAVWFVFYFIFFSFMVGEKVPRYMAPTIPAVAVLAVYSLNYVIKKLSLPKELVLAVLLVGAQSIPLGFAITKNKVNTYTGLQELGKKTGEFDSKYGVSKIYAQSARQIKAFSDSSDKVVGLPQSRDTLTNQTKIILEVDSWEYSAPDWAFPLTQEKLNALLAMNFTIVHVVQRDVPTRQGLQKVPVGFLLAR